MNLFYWMRSLFFVVVAYSQSSGVCLHMILTSLSIYVSLYLCSLYIRIYKNLNGIRKSSIAISNNFGNFCVCILILPPTLLANFGSTKKKTKKNMNEFKWMNELTFGKYPIFNLFAHDWKFTLFLASLIRELFEMISTIENEKKCLHVATILSYPD